jgi:putative spermidine/putrescine transport system permease protein
VGTLTTGQPATAIPPAPLTARSDRRWRTTLAVVITGGLLMLVVPTLIVLVTAFDTRQVIGFPPHGFGFSRFTALAQDQDLLGSAWLSLTVALAAVVIDIVLGVPAAIAFVRREFKGKAFLLSFLQMPIMLPGIVIGIALLIFVSTLAMDLSIPLLVAGHVVLTFPFVLRIAMSRMERADIAVEEAARNLGASKLDVFCRIQLPFLAPGILSGSAFAFLTSFDNLTVSLFLTPVGHMTLPVQLFFLMRFDLDPVVAAVATAEILITLGVIGVGFKMMGEDALTSL